MEKYVQPFIDTCVSVFNDFTGLKVIPQVPYFIDRSEKNNWDITGVIGLTGEAQGAVSISMKQEFAKHITTLLTEEEHTTLDDVVVDAIGEIINIIAGNVKKGLEEMYALVISLPTIVKGENHETIWPNQNNRAVCIPFEVDDKTTFALSVVLRGQE